MKNNEKKLKGRINNFSKIAIIFFAFLFLTSNIVCYANLEDNEIIDINEIKKEIVEVSAKESKEPKLNAKIGLIFDRASKTILYEKNGQKQVPMASTTKIMTAIVVLENSDLTDIVTIDKKAAGTGGSRLGLKTNDKITVHDLLYGLMLCSGNDAAVALAIHTGGSVDGFADMMNETAKEMNLVNSHFVTPHGLDQNGHYTTAYELACMADYALKIPKFREIVSTKTYTVTINGKAKTVTNTNELLGSLDGVYGVKTGFTNGANRCLVTAYKGGKLDIITVVLGADTKKIRTQDSIKMIEYAYKNYQVVSLEEIVQEQFEKWKQLNEKRIYINKGRTSRIYLQLEEMENKTMAIKNTEVDNITLEINSLYSLEAPVLENEVIGNIKIKLKDKTIGTLSIQNKKTIEKKNIKDYFIDFLSLLP